MKTDRYSLKNGVQISVRLAVPADAVALLDYIEQVNGEEAMASKSCSSTLNQVPTVGKDAIDAVGRLAVIREQNLIPGRSVRARGRPGVCGWTGGRACG